MTARHSRWGVTIRPRSPSLTTPSTTTSRSTSSGDTSFVREAVENEEIVVPYVRTVDNFADFFTKPIVRHNFFRMRDVIMNCDSRASKAAGRAMALRAIPERRMAPPAAAVVSREWTLAQIASSAGPYPTSDPRWCEVTASGMVSQHYACDRDNACAVASAPCCGRAMLARSAVLRNPPPSDGGAFGREPTLTHNTIVRTHAPCSYTCVEIGN